MRSPIVRSLALVVAGILLAGCTGSGTEQLPAPHSKHAFARCSEHLPGIIPAPGRLPRHLFVAPKVKQAVICRYKGLEGARRTWRVLLRAAFIFGRHARRFARLFDRSRIVPRGRAYNCPMDLGDADLVIFIYQYRQPMVVRVELTACGFVYNGKRSAVPRPSVGRALARLVGLPRRLRHRRPVIIPPSGRRGTARTRSARPPAARPPTPSGR